MFRTLFKGWFGEKSTQLGMWLYLDEQVYRRFHDVIVPSRNGTTQIDHIVVSVYGIFVVETKNHSGWVFGDEHAAQWTAVYYGKKFRLHRRVKWHGDRSISLSSIFFSRRLIGKRLVQWFTSKRSI